MVKFSTQYTNIYDMGRDFPGPFFMRSKSTASITTEKGGHREKIKDLNARHSGRSRTIVPYLILPLPWRWFDRLTILSLPKERGSG